MVSVRFRTMCHHLLGMKTSSPGFWIKVRAESWYFLRIRARVELKKVNGSVLAAFDRAFEEVK